MILQKPALIVVIFSLASFFVVAQNSPTAEINSAGKNATETDRQKNKKRAPQIPSDVKEKAITLLQATVKESVQLHLPENRLVFALHLADLLWEHDEREARAIYNAALDDARAVLGELRRLAEQPEDERGYESYFGWQQSARTAKELRRALVLHLAERDPAMAEAFYYETRALLFAPTPNAHDPWLKSFISENDENQLEAQLNAVLAKNDPARSLAFGLAQLAKDKGVPSNMSELANRLYEKDAEKGAKLAREVLKKLHTVKGEFAYQGRSAAFELFKNAATIEENLRRDKASKQPLLNEAELRQLAEFLVQKGLTENIASYSSYEYQQNLALLTKYAPSSAPRLNAKLTALTSKSSLKTESEDESEDYKIGEENRTAVRLALEKQQAEEQRLKQLEEFGNKLESSEASVSPEEVQQKLGLIKNRNERFFAQISVAAILADRGDKKAAREMLDGLRAQLVARPIYSLDCLRHLAVARAYVSVEPKQTFEMLETLVAQLNDVVGGVVKFGEFFAGEAAIANSEVRMGTFGDFLGQLTNHQEFNAAPKISGKANPLGDIQTDLALLAIADFDRLQAVADKFERNEVRLTARVLILKSILGAKTAAPETSPQITAPSAETVR